MDDTACEFTNGVVRWFNLSHNHKFFGDKYYAPKLMGLNSTNDLWHKINLESFWQGLACTSFLPNMLRFAKNNNARIVFLTKFPSACPASLIGKLNWVKHYDDFTKYNLDNRPIDIILTSSDNKYLLAKPDSFLFDDKKSTIDEFVKNGGHGFLVPALTNEKYQDYLSGRYGIPK